MPLRTLDPANVGVFLCDFDRDGIIDVLITDKNGYFLYKGLPDGKFKNVTKEMGLPEMGEEATSRALAAACTAGAPPSAGRTNFQSRAPTAR